CIRVSPLRLSLLSGQSIRGPKCRRSWAPARGCFLAAYSGDVNSALTLDVADDLRSRALRRQRVNEFGRKTPESVRLHWVPAKPRDLLLRVRGTPTAAHFRLAVWLAQCQTGQVVLAVEHCWGSVGPTPDSPAHARDRCSSTHRHRR